VIALAGPSRAAKLTRLSAGSGYHAVKPPAGSCRDATGYCAFAGTFGSDAAANAFGKKPRKVARPLERSRAAA
jgi:hypothetical protein